MSEDRLDAFPADTAKPPPSPAAPEMAGRFPP